MGRILEVWFPLLVVFSKMEVLVLAQAQDPTPTVKAGYINIDCGAPNDYDDTTLSLHYYTDAGFVDSGENRQISTQFIESQIWQQTKNLRVFYTGTRNCYTLRTDRGKGKKYFIRAMFFYGNYDGKNQNPKFDLYIGTDYWSTVDTTSNDYDYEEIIHSPRTDDIQVCLVNTGNGFPFISNLELRLLDDSSYQVDSAASLNKMWRYDIGGSRSYYRYPQDAYDRLWYAKSYGWITLNSTGTPGLTNNSDAYKVPEEVMQTVQRAADANSSIKLEWRTITNSKWQIYFHFAELEYLPRDQKRQFNVYVNGELTETVTLEYLKPVSVASGLVYGSQFDFSINATNKSSQYPPILNAVEFYTIVSHFTTPTAEDDITAMYDIKKFYGIKRESWQGDPCAPKAFIWDGLRCSYDNPPRIITLNMRYSRLKGPIAASFSNLTALESLDLSFNELTGPLPELLALLPNLRVLNLSGNNLSGPIPEALRERNSSTERPFLLSLDENPNICLACASVPNQKKKRTVIPVAVAVSSAILILMCVVAGVCMLRRRRKQVSRGTKELIKSEDNITFSKDASDISNEGSLRIVNKILFTSSEVSVITKNYKDIIGEGGFGNVYLGILGDGTNVAVKVLSSSSKQGYKEFLSEAKLLMVVHHKNVVSLVGYCDGPENISLVYEYMSNGNLRQRLSDQTKDVLGWMMRLQIGIDAAEGLEYLHNGCRRPIVHRDLKTSNILLNHKMQAKIADFGLSRIFATDQDTHILTRPAGTPGYLDPMFHAFRKLSKKTDVYSFGIILLELITGLPAIIRDSKDVTHIVQWVSPFVEKGDIERIVDPRIHGQFDSNSARKAIEIAMQCVQLTTIQRPGITRVLLELKDCLAI